MMRVALLWAASTKSNAFAITLPPGRMMSSNLVTDGDFEAASSSWTTGDPCPWNSIKPVGWDVGSFGGDYIVTSGTGNCDGMGQVARQGTFFVQLHSHDQFFQQVSGLPVGDALTLSFWATARPTQGDSYLMVMVDDVQIGNTGIIPDCTSRAASCWTQHEFTFTPTSATAKIGFQFCRGNRDMTPGCCTSCGGWHASPFIDDVMLMGAGTPSPTPSPTPPPTQAVGASGASAVGDPHLQNVHGERFDLMKEGRHVLINIPRGKGAEQAMLRVQADARRLGGNCADMYFQELNVTGSWAEARQAGGYRYSASQSDVETPGWAAFGKVELKVVHGRTDGGLRYLNVYVKHLARAGFPVGGLLGEDDHDDVMAPPEHCAQKMALVDGVAGGLGAPSASSVAEASLA
ncbi:unnamed protein product [Prorocentrum cordatum]|uniref:CBM-cenC domain-containing protein n=1 Tax=Prorocentrum cordatum TaxID=2364126 RepID=A0ABN9XKA7_9DINO|nr:unnamed protein product [Polarella glacialis]